MKKSFLLMMLIGSLFGANGQNTNYGTGSGTLGTNNSNFGYNSGNSNGASSAENSFFGTSAGRFNTSGINNSAF